MAELKPHPALIVDTDTPIGDCIRRMRDHGTGSVLVISGTFPRDLVGIFTERDVLRWIDEIQDGGYWHKPVASLMSKPLRTVSIYDLESAPRMMIEAGIRHLPVVYNDEAGLAQVAGVISIKDLLRRLSELLGPSPEPTGPHWNKTVAVASKDEKVRKEWRALFAQGGRLPIVEWNEEAPARLGELENRSKIGIVVFDLDRYTPDEWLASLRQARLHAEGPPVLFIHGLGLHDPRNIAYLKDLAKTGRFALLARPVAALEALHQIRIWMGSRERLA